MGIAHERGGLYREMPGYAHVEMPTITLLLDAGQLENPDLDLRYAIPELLRDRSSGLIRDGGYDYETDQVLALYLLVDDAAAATELIETVLREVVILDNHLAGRFTLRAEPTAAWAAVPGTAERRSKACGAEFRSVELGRVPLGRDRAIRRA